MARNDYAEVRVAVVEGNTPLRMDLRTALVHKGIRDPFVCKDAAAFAEVAANETLDVVVCDANTMGDAFTSSLQRIRRNDLGGNPFVIAIATLHDASMDGVRTALDSGVDHLLLKPAPVCRVIERIEHLVWERQPFVVTKGYVGPTRRNQKRANDDKDVVMGVPNTLRGKVVDKLGEDRLRRMIDQAVVGLREKMERHPLLGIDRLIQRTLAYADGGMAADELRRDFGYLMELGLELGQRYRGTAFAHIAELAVALANLAKRIATRNPGDLQPGDLAPLSHLGEVIRRAVAAEERLAEVGKGALPVRTSMPGPGPGPRPTPVSAIGASLPGAGAPLNTAVEWIRY